MIDDFDQRMRASTRVRKLMGLAAGNQNQHEAEAAVSKARALAREHGLKIEGLTPISPEDDLAERRAEGRKRARALSQAIARSMGGADDTDYTKYARPEDLDDG